ncbi:MAG: NADPH-dependent 7-cyano-7-deazaguanine reductase QueF [Gammaproteobacteria bacterium]|nr:MAG: NADPH-dependent 7-cyano-7-deazaguanine reductase QueF [Gammaproteobacteria bacterium]
MSYIPEQSELGKKTAYDAHYSPDKLYPIPRQPKRDEIGVQGKLPFFGCDLWNHYEVSWLNEKGKPVVALAEIIYGCESVNIIESKSMKLYFNSFNNTQFKDAATVAALVKQDIEARIHAPVTVNIMPLDKMKEEKLSPVLEGICIDHLDIECSIYTVDPSFLKTDDQVVQETVYSDLLKSNCLVTNQPDWCSVQITYKGKKINHEGLLRYIVSFRNCNEFHEQCIEKIFMHILQRCQPEELTVYGRSTRRGGIDINSYRSTKPVVQPIPNIRLSRQ